MLTIKEVGKEMTEVQKNSVSYVKDDGRYKIFQKRFEFLYGIKLYLESKPREEFVKDEQARLIRVIKIINDRYPEWLAHAPKNNIIGKERTYYNRITNIAAYKKQLKTINFILQSFEIKY